MIKYKGKLYDTGNRYDNLVELFRDGKFLFVVKQLKNGTCRRLDFIHYDPLKMKRL